LRADRRSRAPATIDRLKGAGTPSSPDVSMARRSISKQRPDRSPRGGSPSTGSPPRAVVRESAPTAPGLPREEVEPSVICRLSVPLPNDAFLGPHLRRHPEDEVEAIDWLLLDSDRMILELRIRGPSARDWVPELHRDRRVERVEPLDDGKDGPHVFVTLRLVAGGFVPLFQKHRVIRRRPYTIRHGVATWTVIGPERRIHAMMRELTRRVPETHLDSIGRIGPPRRSSPLTHRQQQVLQRALEEGYFAVPSRISLTELARRIGISKSTLSTTLATIEHRLLGNLPLDPATAR